MVKVPIKLDNDDAKAEVKKGSMAIPLLYPHQVLHYVHSVVKLTVHDESVRSYWQRAAEHGAGWAINQPDHSVIPVGIYADETKYGLHESQEKVLAVFLNLVLFRPRNIRLSRFLLCTIRSKFLLPGTATLYPIMHRIVWSMGWASKGVFPSTGFMGSALPKQSEQLAGQSLGAKFLVTELRGDLAWHKLIWGFQDGWSSTKVCFFCEATGTGSRRHLYYEHVGDRALWRTTIFRDNLEWIAAKLDLNNLCFLLEKHSCLKQIKYRNIVTEAPCFYFRILTWTLFVRVRCTMSTSGFCSQRTEVRCAAARIDQS